MMSTNSINPSSVYEANSMDTKDSTLNHRFYSNFESEEVDAILLDYNPIIHGINRTEWCVDTPLAETVEEELSSVMKEEFEDNWDEKVGIYSDQENLTDVYDMVDAAKENDIPVYTPDNMFGKVLRVLDSPKYPDKRAAQETIQSSVFNYLASNTRAVRFTENFRDVLNGVYNGKHPEKRRPDEDRTLSKLARDKNAVVATYDTDFVDSFALAEGFTPKQLAYMVRDQNEESHQG